MYKKAINVLNKKSIGQLFSLKFHYLTYKFKAETDCCLLVSLKEKNATFLLENRIGIFDLDDKDIVLYARQT